MNQKRYWLRGGITGLVVGIFYFLIGWIFPSLGEILIDIFAIIFKPTFALLKLFRPIKLELGSLIFAISFSLFLYGMILGWFYGKVKNRNNVI